MRAALVILLGLFVFGAMADGASASTNFARVAGACAALSDTPAVSQESVVSAALGETGSTAAECNSGHCSGAKSCHCSCHGLGSGLPANFVSDLSIVRTADRPRPLTLVISHQPPPPVRPPRI